MTIRRDASEIVGVAWTRQFRTSGSQRVIATKPKPFRRLVQRSAIFLIRGPASNRIIFSISRKLAMTVDVDLLTEGGLLLSITGVQMYHGCRQSRGSYRSGSCHEPSQSLGDRATQKGSWISPIKGCCLVEIEWLGVGSRGKCAITDRIA